MSHDSPSREKALASVPESLRRAFIKFRNERWHENLDNCHGICQLRQSRCAGIVAESLVAFDGDDLERFVVMPNHVHVLVKMRPGWDIRKQCESWMRFSARRINTLVGSAGAFWAEPFDHIVRTEAQFHALQIYVAENPVKARIPSADCLLWIRGCGFVTSPNVARLSES